MGHDNGKRARNKMVIPVCARTRYARAFLLSKVRASKLPAGGNNALVRPKRPSDLLFATLLTVPISQNSLQYVCQSRQFVGLLDERRHTVPIELNGKFRLLIAA